MTNKERMITEIKLNHLLPLKIKIEKNFHIINSAELLDCTLKNCHESFVEIIYNLIKSGEHKTRTKLPI